MQEVWKIIACVVIAVNAGALLVALYYCLRRRLVQVMQDQPYRPLSSGTGTGTGDEYSSLGSGAEDCGSPGSLFSPPIRHIESIQDLRPAANIAETQVYLRESASSNRLVLDHDITAQLDAAEEGAGVGEAGR